MAPGERSHRRRRALAAVLAAAAAVFTLSAAPAASASPSGYTGGEEGSGMPAIPFVVPHPHGRLATRSTAVRFSDVTSEFAWASRAIDHVAGANDWMRDLAPNDDGTYPFDPASIETRKYFARALVLAFAPDDVPDGTLVFADLDPSSPWYRFASVATQRGWIKRTSDGTFQPDAPVTMRQVHRGLVLALGLGDAAKALNDLHTRNGVTFTVPPGFGTTLLGMRLGLRYNAPTGNESIDVGPRDALNRAQVAYSLFRATTLPSWTVPDLLEQYDVVELPFLGPRQQQLVQWGVRFVGYPYVWGGEWGLETPEPSALGGQPRSGFDCSGFAWWLLKANDGGAWSIAPPRPYPGWSLPERTSAWMAAAADAQLTWDELRPGDLAFYDGDGDGVVDHVDTYIGNGYALDSSSTPGGVTIMWVGDGWYRDHFVFGRRVTG